jgi:hypothetical protein
MRNQFLVEPKVGNLGFLHAFEVSCLSASTVFLVSPQHKTHNSLYRDAQVLEEERKIRCLRVANFRDLVPLSPPRHAYNCLAPICCQSRRFRHVGMRLKLFPYGYIISYPPKMRTCPGIFCCDFIKLVRHFLYLVVVCPIVTFCKNRYIYKVFRSEHTVLVYMDRLNACEDILSGMQLDDLYEESSQRSRLRLPTLHGDSHVLRTQEEYYKKKPWMAFSAILEV